MTSDVLCSDQRNELLPGTAKTGTLFIALEHAHGWGRDIMDGDTFGSELTAEFAGYLKKHGASLQLIRKPGREGQLRSKRTVFIADTRVGTMCTLLLDRPEDLLSINPHEPHSELVDHPVILVCTHGKRDRCCALKGRPLAAHLDQVFPGQTVWESSHTRGHRFAPSIIALPWGYSFGHLNDVAAVDMVRHLKRGELFLAGNRGRSCYAAPDQVAELAVASHLVATGERVLLGSLSATGGQVTHVDGRRFEVTLAQRPVEGIISSCGDAPKTGTSLVAEGIKQVN